LALNCNKGREEKVEEREMKIISRGSMQRTGSKKGGK
jgi:hypothetical protein